MYVNITLQTFNVISIIARVNEYCNVAIAFSNKVSYMHSIAGYVYMSVGFTYLYCCA